MKPTDEQLRDVDWWFNTLTSKYRYCPNTGMLFSNKTSEPIGTKNGGGYTRISPRINGHRYDFLAHRVAFLFVMRRWPSSIDHINGITDDNRWSNLREVTTAENLMNKRLMANNKTGVPGIVRSGIRFRVTINENKTRHHLGYFDDFFEACCARKSAEYKYGYHENHGRTLHDKQ